MTAVGWCPERRRPSQDSFVVRLFVGFRGFFTFFFFFGPYPRLGPARFDVGECLAAEGNSRQRDDVVPGDDTHCMDLRANSGAGRVEGSVLSAGEGWRENGKAGTGCLLRKALLCRGKVDREDCAVKLSVTLQSSTLYCVICLKT